MRGLKGSKLLNKLKEFGVNANIIETQEALELAENLYLEDYINRKTISRKEPAKEVILHEFKLFTLSWELNGTDKEVKRSEFSIKNFVYLNAIERAERELFYTFNYKKFEFSHLLNYEKEIRNKNRVIFTKNYNIIEKANKELNLNDDLVNFLVDYFKDYEPKDIYEKLESLNISTQRTIMKMYGVFFINFCNFIVENKTQKVS